MSAFPESGRSGIAKTTEKNVRLRPRAVGQPLLEYLNRFANQGVELVSFNGREREGITRRGQDEPSLRIRG